MTIREADKLFNFYHEERKKISIFPRGSEARDAAEQRAEIVWQKWKTQVWDPWERGEKQFEPK